MEGWTEGLGGVTSSPDTIWGASLESSSLSVTMNWTEVSDEMSFPETTSSEGVGMVDEPGAEEVVLVAAT